MRRGKPVDAESVFEKVFKADPESASLGQTMIRTANDFRSAIEQKSGCVDERELGVILADQFENDAQLDKLRRLLEIAREVRSHSPV